jgi:hypothetical protein
MGAEKPNSVPEKDPKYIPVDLEFNFLSFRIDIEKTHKREDFRISG